MTQGVEAVRADQRTLFGHPRGLAVLSFSELWERFSYYGMMGLLTLYMTNRLLQPGHVEKVLGFGPFKAGLEAVFGHLSTVALASQIFGLYTGFVYVTPILGGLIGDRWLGQRRTVVIGVVLMALGHLAMASEPLFLLALLLLILGCGCLKGNMAAQVGRLYAPEDTRRTQAFAIYLAALNVGGLTAPLVVGTLGEKVDWHWGFTAAGLGMLVGLVAYLAGQKNLPPDTVRRSKDGHVQAPPLTRRDWTVIGGIVVLLVPYVLAIAAYNQSWNIFMLWGSTQVDRRMLGVEMPVTWYATIDGVLTIVALALAARLWAVQRARDREPGDMTKVAFGMALFTAGFLVLSAAAFAAGPDRMPIWPTLLYFVLVDLAIPFVDTVTMSLISRAAPAAVNTTMIGVYYLAAAAGNILVGWLGRFYDGLSHAGFWLLHAGVAGAGLAIILVLRGPLTRLFAPRPGDGS